MRRLGEHKSQRRVGEGGLINCSQEGHCVVSAHNYQTNTSEHKQKVKNEEMNNKKERKKKWSPGLFNKYSLS